MCDFTNRGQVSAFPVLMLYARVSLLLFSTTVYDGIFPFSLLYRFVTCIYPFSACTVLL